MSDGTDEFVVAVVPAVDEAATIQSVVTDLGPYVDEVIVVSDGSVDGTDAIASRAGARVVSHARRLGYDRSIADGVALPSNEKPPSS